MKIVLKKNDKIYGPYEHTQVEQFIRERRLLPQDPVAIVGTEVWQPLSVLLQNIAATTPANPQPPMQVPPHYHSQSDAQRRPDSRQHFSGGRSNEQALHSARWFSRVSACLTDVLICVVAMIVAGFIVAFGGHTRNLMSASWIVGYGFCLVYWVGFYTSKWRATPGKRMLGLQVVTLDRQQLSLLNSLFRQAAFVVISMIPLVNLVSLIMPLWDARRRTLHDILSSTCVVVRE